MPIVAAQRPQEADVGNEAIFRKYDATSAVHHANGFRKFTGSTECCVPPVIVIKRNPWTYELKKYLSITVRFVDVEERNFNPSNFTVQKWTKYFSDFKRTAVLFSNWTWQNIRTAQSRKATPRWHEPPTLDIVGRWNSINNTDPIKPSKSAVWFLKH